MRFVSRCLMMLAALAILAVPAFSEEGATPAPAANAAPVEKKLQTMCPVMGGAIDKENFVDFQGQRVRLCCSGCIGEFNKDPEKYMKKIEDDNVLLESIQTTCPVTGNPIDKKQFVDYKGRRVNFCCGGCNAQFAKDPAKYLAKLPPVAEAKPAETPVAK